MSVFPPVIVFVLRCVSLLSVILPPTSNYLFHHPPPLCSHSSLVVALDKSTITTVIAHIVCVCVYSQKKKGDETIFTQKLLVYLYIYTFFF